MEKVFKILIVFGMLLFLILYSMRVLEKKFREYYFSRRMAVIPGGGDEGRLSVLVDRMEPAAAKDMAHQLLFIPGERSVRVIDDLTGNLIVVIGLDRDPHGLIFDGQRGLLYCCSADGMVMILRQTDPAVYTMLQSFEIPAEAGSLAVDLRSGDLSIRNGGEDLVYSNS